MPTPKQECSRPSPAPARPMVTAEPAHSSGRTHLLLPLQQLGPSVGGAGLCSTRPPAQCGLQHWLLWAKPCSVGDMSISCHPGRKQSEQRLCRHGPAPPSLSPPPCCWPAEAVRGPRRVPAAGRCLQTHGHRHTCTQKRKDPDTQRRKDMDVLKIAQNPLNLQTSEMLKAPCQETRPLPRSRQQGPSVKRPVGQGTQHPAAGDR